MTKRTRFIVAVTVMVAVTAFGLWAQEHVKLPGINSEDQHPNGCVDCHKISGDSDYRLNVSLREVAGHPAIDSIVNTLPDDCMMCHGSYAAKLNTITHTSHYANPEENHFVAYYGGQCLECHSIDVDTGKTDVKSGPKNW